MVKLSPGILTKSAIILCAVFLLTFFTIITLDKHSPGSSPICLICLAKNLTGEVPDTPCLAYYPPMARHHCFERVVGIAGLFFPSPVKNKAPPVF
jgi:hypothetical protein